jgi:FkbM family methyltransferase
VEALTELVGGYVWPRCDVNGRKAAFCFDEIEVACGFVTDWSTCVQAGGFTGIWPRQLAARFGHVYTFEPDPLNFYCLERNVEGLAVTCSMACLGDVPRTVQLTGGETNKGATYVDPAMQPGATSMVTIDELGLERCGLIYLDVEGFEALALRGATMTIARCRPVIAVENKHSDRYGFNSDRLEDSICALGYQVVARPRRDVVFIHESSVRQVGR